MEAHTVGRRDRELAAKHRLDDAKASLERARRKVGHLRGGIRPLMAQRGNTAEAGHAAADALAEVAEARFQAALRDYLPTLKTVVADAADPPPANLVAAFVLARGAGELYAALHAAIDADVDDASTATFEVATEGEVADAIDAKHAEVRAAEGEVAELEQALEEAEEIYATSIEGR